MFRLDSSCNRCQQGRVTLSPADPVAVTTAGQERGCGYLSRERDAWQGAQAQKTKNQYQNDFTHNLPLSKERRINRQGAGPPALLAPQALPKVVLR
jgi:hypothetical protein